MIQKANVGVGISGAEGLQAACASDYSIAQVRGKISNSQRHSDFKLSQRFVFLVSIFVATAAGTWCMELFTDVQTDSVQFL